MKKQNRTLLYLMMIGLSILLVMRDVYGVPLSKFIYFGFIAAFMAVANYQVLVQMICFILPLLCGLPGTYIMPVALVWLVTKRKTFKTIQSVPLLIFLLLELFATMWYPSLQLPLIIQYISFAGVMIFLINDDKELDYRSCIKCYLLGVVLLCAVIMTVTLEGAPTKWLKLFAEGRFRFGDAHVDEIKMQLALNANSLAYYSLTGVSCGILLTEKEKGVKRLLYLTIALFAVIIGFLTLSRSWLVVLLAGMLLYIISKLRDPKQFVILAVVLLVLVGIGSVYLENNPELLSGFEMRFEDDMMESGGSRTYIFKKYMEIYFGDLRYVFFGAGVTQTNEAVGSAGSMHNGLQQILVCCGIVGFALYMVVLILPIWKACRGKKLSMIHWLPLISVVTFTQTIQFLNPMMLMLPYIIGIYALRAGGQNGENISDNR